MSWRQTLLFVALLSPFARSASSQVPTYRARILGVFDDASGAPVDSVRVAVVLSRNSSLPHGPAPSRSAFFPTVEVSFACRRSDMKSKRS